MFWSYTDESEKHLWKVSFVTKDAVTGEMLKGKGQNHENFKTNKPSGNKGEILWSLCLQTRALWLKQWGVSTYLSFSSCDKPLAQGHLPKWRGLGGFPYKEVCHSVLQLNKTITHNKRCSTDIGWLPSSWDHCHVQVHRHCFVSVVHGVIVQYNLLWGVYHLKVRKNSTISRAWL